MLRSLPARRFGTLIIVVAGLLIGLTAALNILVDPYRLYQTGLVDPLVQTPRTDKYELLVSRPTPPDVLILGSSRANRLSPALAADLTGLDTFNAAVSRATPVDFLVWTRFMIDGLNHPPSLMIVNLDPEAFNPVQSWTTPAWLNNSPLAPYGADITLQPVANPVEDTLRKLIFWQQTLDSLNVLQLDATQNRPPRLIVFDDDGGYYVTEPEREASTVPDTGYLIPFYQNYPALDADNLAYLEQFIALCDANNINLIIYLPPLHPDLLAALRTQSDFTARRDDLLAAVSGLQSRYSFRFYDLVEVSSFAGNPATFLNADHMDNANSEQLLRFILNADARPDAEGER